jgi:hypothetical protein
LTEVVESGLTPPVQDERIFGSMELIRAAPPPEVELAESSLRLYLDASPYVGHVARYAVPDLVVRMDHAVLVMEMKSVNATTVRYTQPFEAWPDVSRREPTEGANAYLGLGFYGSLVGRLADEWERATDGVPNRSAMRHDAYRSLRQFGRVGTRTALSRVGSDGEHLALWIAFLRRTVGVDAPRIERPGNLVDAAAAWRRWGWQHGYTGAP